jgi:hypothetical protein
MTRGITPYGAITLMIIALSITAFSIMSLDKRGLYVTLRVEDTEHNQHSA